MIDKVSLKSQLNTVLNEMFEYIDSDENVTTHTFRRKNYPVFSILSLTLCSELRLKSSGLLKFDIDNIERLKNKKYERLIIFTLLLNDKNENRIYHQYSPGSLVDVKDEWLFQIFVDSSYETVDELIDWLSDTIKVYVKDNVGKLQTV